MIIRRHITSNFTIIPNEALMDERLTIGARWLLCYLLSRPQDWQVQIVDIQKKAAVGREKAYALVRELIAVGWVRKDESRQPDGKWGGVEYVVMDQAEAAPPPFPENPYTAEPLAENQHLTKNGPLPKTESTKLSAEAEAGFEEFWAAYPRRPNNPRKAAMAAYKKALASNVSVKHLLTAAQAYASFMEGENPKFVAMASTWLNGERWNNDYTKNGEVLSAYKAVKYGTPQDVINSAADVLQQIVAHYPGIPDTGAVSEIHQLILRGEKPEALVEAAEKYKLWVKHQKGEGINLQPPALSTWLKFRWREMDNYVFCYRGMTNKKSVKPRKGLSHEDSARTAG